MSGEAIAVIVNLVLFCLFLALGLLSVKKENVGGIVISALLAGFFFMGTLAALYVLIRPPLVP